MAVYTKVSAVTPSDTTDLPGGDAVLYVTTAGTLAFVPVDLSNPNPATINLPAAPVGELPFRVSRVKLTGTTAVVLACS